MNKILDSKYPYLSNYYSTAIAENRLFHSIIMYGSNIYMQYATSLELARQLNCLEDGREDCQCQNCRWIRENRHPAVMTISKIDNKTDSSKTVISEEQINQVLNNIAGSSDYHRVFIFCDAEIIKPSNEEKNDYNEFKTAGFNTPQGEDDKKIWYPNGINSKCFSSVGANAMLKSIEEPPSNVTFIFLTTNKDDMLQTIVSRSQIFYVPGIKFTKYDTSFFEKYFENYPYFKKESALDFSQCLLNYQTEKGLESEYIIDCIQYYLIQLLKINVKNTVIYNKILKDIKKAEESKRMLKAYIKEQIIYEDLAFYFAK